MRRKNYTEDFKKMIIEGYNTGKPIKEICEEISKLKKENEKIKMELEILKKAIAIFSQDQEI